MQILLAWMSLRRACVYGAQTCKGRHLCCTKCAIMALMVYLRASRGQLASQSARQPGVSIRVYFTSCLSVSIRVYPCLFLCVSIRVYPCLFVSISCLSVSIFWPVSIRVYSVYFFWASCLFCVYFLLISCLSVYPCPSCLFVSIFLSCFFGAKWTTKIDGKRVYSEIDADGR